MAKFLYLVLLLAICTVSAIAGRSPPLPLPSSLSSCSGLVMSMMDCLGYLQDGSTVTVPSANCCDGLKLVVKASPSCICEGFQMASDLGIKLNMTRALGLPQACSVQAPDVPDCSERPAPAPAPVVPAPSPAPVVPTPSPSKPVLPPRSAPSPAPPVSPPTPSQPSPSPPVSPPTPSAAVPPPPAQISLGPSLAPSSSQSSSWQLSASLLVLCVGVAVASFSYVSI